MEVFRTEIFDRWFRRLKDVEAKARINVALRRCSLAGHVVGDTKSVGGGVRELRIHFGPGYRVYYVMRGQEMMLLLVGGAKSSQKRDVMKAKELAREVRGTKKWQ